MFISLCGKINKVRNVLAIRSTGTNTLWKELKLSSDVFGKAFRLEPECERVSDFAAQHQPEVTSIVEEQFRKYELIELGFSAAHLKD